MEKTSWIERLSDNLERYTSEEVRCAVLQGGEGLSSGSAPGAKARWVCGMIERLESFTDDATRKRIMTTCSCLYRRSDIQRLNAIYKQAGIDAVITDLQESRRQELRRRIKDEDLWRLAQTQPFFTTPMHDGNRLVHIAPPYHPQIYLQQTDFVKKRVHYCHCGWISASKTDVSPTFCTCGTGYYKSLWEGILEQPVEVDLCCTIFSGAEDCRVQVMLPF